MAPTGDRTSYGARRYTLPDIGNPLQAVANFLNQAGVGLRREASAAEGGGGRPEGSMATLGNKPVQWVGGRWVPFLTEGQMAREEQARINREAPPAPVLPPAAAAALAGAGRAPGMGVTPIVRGDDDQYRQLLSQYGALSKAGKQEEAEKVGMDIWQQKYGKTKMGQPGGAVGTFNPLMQSTFGYQKGQQDVPTYAGQPSADFAVAANAVPAPWNEQGFKVSQEFAGVVPFQAAKTTGEGMPAFQTTGEKAAEFLGRPNIRTLF